MNRPWFARRALRAPVRNRGLYCERLEDRIAPARGISPTEVLAGVREVLPINILDPGQSPWARLGINTDRVTFIGPGMARIATEGADPETFVNQLQTTPGVAWAQPNYVYEVRTDSFPNDKNYSSQSSLSVMRVPQAWDHLLKSGKTLGNPGTVIAVLDVGISVIPSTAQPGHFDLANGPGNTTGIALNNTELGNDEDGNGFVGDFSGWDFIDNDNDPSPLAGANHGLQVASIAAARTNNFNDIGTSSRIAGIAGGSYDDLLEDQVGGVRVLPIRVISGLLITTSSLAGGLNYAASRFVRIANLSFDLDGFSKDNAVHEAMTNLYNAGTLILGSAGNTDTQDAPRGVFDQVLFVGGTNNSDKIASEKVNGSTYSSNFGTYVDLMAPSENIAVLTGSNAFTTESGTSFAAPAVAGVAALLLAQNPSYTRDQLAAKLLGTAVNIDHLNPGYEGMLGAGRVDALNALTQPLAAPTITDIKINGVSIQDGDTVNGFSTVEIQFKGVLNPASVKAAAFELRSDGPDNVFGTEDDVIVPLSVLNPYRIGDTSVIIIVSQQMSNDRYRFTAKGGSNFLRDPFDSPFMNGDTAIYQIYLGSNITSGFFHKANTLSDESEHSFISTGTFPDGGFISVWHAHATDERDIMARRFDRFGQPVSAEFRINAQAIGDQILPSVATMNNGEFIVVWESTGHGANPNGYSVLARRFDGKDRPMTDEILVDNSDMGFSNGRSSGVAAVNAGFVVVFNKYENESMSKDRDIYLRQYSASNTPVTTEPVLVPTNVTGHQSNPVVASDDLGNYAVAWSSPDGVIDKSGSAVFYKIYNPLGVSVSADLVANTTTLSDQYPVGIHFDSFGYFAISWDDRSMGASLSRGVSRRFDAVGVPLTNEIIISNSSTGNNILHRIVNITPYEMFATWTAELDSKYSVYGQHIDIYGAKLGPVVSFNTPNVQGHFSASVSANRTGHFTTSWHVDTVPGQAYVAFSNSTGIAQIAHIRPNQDSNTIDPGERVVQTVSSLVAGFTMPLKPGTPTNAANWQLTIDGLDESSIISSINYTGTPASNGLYEVTLNFSEPILIGNVTLRAKDSIQDLNGNALDGDADGKFGGDYMRNFTVANVGPQGDQIQVNATTNGDQVRGSITVLPNGRSIVVWEGSGPGDSYGIFARMLDANMQPTTGDILINQFTSFNQQGPVISSDAEGNFTVAWQSHNQDGNDQGVFARRFNSVAQPLGNEFQVNQTTQGFQGNVSMATSIDGTTIIVWQSPPPGGGLPDIYARNYDSDGNATTNEYVVNSYKTGSQLFPWVSCDANGNYVVAWHDDTQEGNGSIGVFARLFRADGTPQGLDIHVNEYTLGEQSSATVAMANDGQFVVSWRSVDQGEVGLNNYFRIFNSAGVPITGEKPVANKTNNNQRTAVVRYNEDNTWSAVWVTNHIPTSNDIAFRRFNGAGIPLADEIALTDDQTNHQTGPRIAFNAKGHGVVVWDGYGPTDPAGVYAIKIGGNSSLTSTGIPTQTALEDKVVSFVELTGIFSDPNNPTPQFTYSILNNSNPDLVTPQIFADTVFLFPKPNANGSSVITVRATIPGGLYADASFALIVQPVNDPPAFVKGPNLVNVINAAPQTVPNWATGISGGPGENDLVSFEILSNTNPSLFTVQPAISSSGTLTYATAAAEYGAAVIQVRAKDNGGTANGGVDVSPVQTFVITVDPTNPAIRNLGSVQFVNGGELVGVQEQPAVAVDAVGNRVVLWHGNGAGDSSGVFGQLYASNGAAVGVNFPVNVTTKGVQSWPSVAMAADGSFVAAWQSDENENNQSVIVARRFNAFGVPVSAEIPVSTHVSSGVGIHAGRPVVGLAADGSFTVAWHSGLASKLPGSGGDYNVFHRAFDPENVPRYGNLGYDNFEKLANIATTGDHYNPHLVMHADSGLAVHELLGHFVETAIVIVWQHVNAGTGNVGIDLRLRPFGADGWPTGFEQAVNSKTANDQVTPRLAADADGNVVIVWQSNHPDAANPDIYARRMTRDGKFVEAQEWLVNAGFTTGLQQLPQVGVDADGDFVVGWSGNGPGDADGVFFQRFTRHAEPLGSVVRVNSVTDHSQILGSIMSDADGDVFFVWSGNGKEDASGVYIRRHGYPEPTAKGTFEAVPGEIDLGELFQNNSGPQEALAFSLSSVTNQQSLTKQSINGRILTVEFDPSVSGSAEIAVRVADTTEGLNGLGVIVVRRLAFASPNAAPILEFIRDRSIVEGNTLSLSATAVDKQGANNLIYSLEKTNPTGAAIDSTTGKLTWTSTDNGSFNFTVRVTDPDNGYFTQETFTVVVTNVAPTAKFSGPAVVAPGSTPTFTFNEMQDVAADLPSLRFAYDYNNDGVWDAGGPNYATAISNTSKTAPSSFFSTAGTTRIIRGRVIDKDGGFTDYFLSVNVENVGGSVAPPTATVVLNDGQEQRSNVTTLRVEFSQPVSFPGGLASAFSLIRTGPGGPTGTVPLNFDLVGNVMTITFMASDFTQNSVAVPSLKDGIYAFTVSAANVAGLAGPMQQDVVVNFKRLYGDGNGDATVDSSDFAAFGSAFGTSFGSTFYNAAMDFNFDGTIDSTDFAEFGSRFGFSI